MLKVKVQIGAIHGLLPYPGCIVLVLKCLNYEVCMSYPSKLFPGHMGGGGDATVYSTYFKS